MDFTVPADHRVKRTKKSMEHKSDGDTKCNWCSHQITGTVTGRLRNYNIIKIGHNTKKSPRELRSLFVSQTPLENHQITLVWKTLKSKKLIDSENAMYCGAVVREFVLQSRYYFHFRANTFGKSMNPLILPTMG